MLKRKAIIIVAIFAITLANAVPAFAFAYSGIRWAGTTQYVQYDSSIPSGWNDSGALYRGRQAWNEAGSKFRLYYNSASTNIVKAGYYGNTDWLAQATAWYSNGFITKAEIKFNRTYPWSTAGASGYYDVQSVAAHEFGHWLKLGDLSGSSHVDKTMYYGTGKGETKKRTLHSDDIAGIKWIYGI